MQNQEKEKQTVHSRVLKFRVWNTKGGNFYTEDSVKEHLFGFLSKGNEPVMQYTGLLDKSGKEIYEGDIIWKEFSHRKGQKRESKEDGHKFQIIYQPAWSSFVADEIVKIGEFQELWHLAQNNKWADQERLIVDEFEIIGNIYQNPELLK